MNARRGFRFSSAPRRIRSRGTFIAIIVCGLAASAAEAQTTWYVRASGDDGKDGKSVSNAFKTVAKASAMAASGDRVYIGAGVYNESFTTGVPAIMFLGDPTGKFAGDAGDVILTSSTGPVISHLGAATCELRSMTLRRTGGGSALVMNNGTGELRLTFVKIEGAHAIGIDKTAGLVRMFDCDLSGFSDVGVRSVAGSVSFSRTNIVGASPTTYDDNAGIGVRHGGSSTATLNCCVVADCHVGVRQDGGTVNLNNCIVVGHHDGLLVGSGTTNVRNTTIVDNSRFGIRKAGSGTVQLVSTIVAYSGTALCNVQSGAISGNVVLSYDNKKLADPGNPSFTNLITGDPKFTDPSTRNYRLAAGSAAINPAVTPANCPGDDYLGVIRSDFGSTNDAGAFEYTGVAAQSIPYTCDFEQANHPGWTRQTRVNISEQSNVSGRFGKPTSGPNDTQSLFLLPAPGTSYRLTFDLYKLGTWESGETISVRLNGRVVWTYALAGSTTSTPPIVDSPIWSNGSTSSADMKYRVSLDFVTWDPVATLTFDSTLNESSSDEAWAIDNVNVKAPSNLKIVKWREIANHATP